MTVTESSPQKGDRPSSKTRHPTAPSVMTVTNGHFATVGEKSTKEQYEHGIQVINDVQEFKYALSAIHINNVLTGYPQWRPPQLPLLREGCFSGLQLPPHLCVRFPVHGKVDAAQPFVWHRVRRHVRVRSEANHERNMDVSQQEGTC